MIVRARAKRLKERQRATGVAATTLLTREQDCRKGHSEPPISLAAALRRRWAGAPVPRPEPRRRLDGPVACYAGGWMLRAGSPICEGLRLRLRL